MFIDCFNKINLVNNKYILIRKTQNELAAKKANSKAEKL